METAARGVAKPQNVGLERAADVFADFVPAVGEPERDGGQVAEHILTQREVRGVRYVIAFRTVRVRQVVLSFVVNVVERNGLLFPFVLDDARLAQHVHRRAAHLVDEVIRLDRKLL